MSERLGFELHFAADHPCLEGHFPGQPVVPAVLLLDRIGAYLLEQQGRKIAAWQRVKFLQPVLPPQTLRVEVEVARKGLQLKAFIGEQLCLDGLASVSDG